MKKHGPYFLPLSGNTKQWPTDTVEHLHQPLAFFGQLSRRDHNGACLRGIVQRVQNWEENVTDAIVITVIKNSSTQNIYINMVVNACLKRQLSVTKFAKPN